jgi:hypothetical protein
MSDPKIKTLTLGFNLDDMLFNYYLGSSLTILVDRVGTSDE